MFKMLNGTILKDRKKPLKNMAKSRTIYLKVRVKREIYKEDIEKKYKTETTAVLKTGFFRVYAARKNKPNIVPVNKEASIIPDYHRDRT